MASVRRRAVAALVVLAAPFFPGEVAAFCRLTTCNPSTQTCRKNADGCVRDGVVISWKKLPIVYRIHSAGSAKLEDDAMRAAVRAAFDAWSSVECGAGRTSVRFQKGPDVDDDKPLDGEPAPEPFGIYFRDDTWPSANGADALALTNQLFDAKKGTISYADMEINTARTRFTLDATGAGGDADLQSVLTHEAGHYLGLAHSPVPDSIMVPHYCELGGDRCGDGATVDTKRELADDDIAAVCALYPPTTSEASPEPSTAGCTTTRRPNASPAWLIAAALTAAWRRRRAQRAG